MDKIKVANGQSVACNKILQIDVYERDNPLPKRQGLMNLISGVLQAQEYETTKVNLATNCIFARAVDQFNSLDIIGVEASTSIYPWVVMKSLGGEGAIYKKNLQPFRVSYADNLNDARDLFKMLLPKWTYTLRENLTEIHHPFERDKDVYCYSHNSPAMSFTKATIRAFLSTYGDSQVKALCQAIPK